MSKERSQRRGGWPPPPPKLPAFLELNNPPIVARDSLSDPDVPWRSPGAEARPKQPCETRLHSTGHQDRARGRQMDKQLLGRNRLSVDLG